MRAKLSLILLTVAALAFGRTRTADTIGNVYLTRGGERAWQEMLYEVYKEHNAMCFDIDSILLDAGGVSSDSLSKTAVKATRLWGTQATFSDSVNIDTLVTNKVKVGGGTIFDSLAVIDGDGVDSVAVKVGSKVFKFAVTEQ